MTLLLIVAVVFFVWAACSLWGAAAISEGKGGQDETDNAG